MKTILAKQRKILNSLNIIETEYSPLFSQLVNFSQAKTEPVHSWFRYREGFSPSLVKYFIDNHDEWILDPFCGSGTTLVTSLQMKKNSVGFDINPFSTFLAKIKTTKYTEQDLKKIQQSIELIFNNHHKNPVSIPRLKIIDKAFHPMILEHMLKLREEINMFDGHIRGFLFFGWLSILERVSNTKKEGNGIKYRSTVRTKQGYVHIKDEDWQRNYFGPNKIDFINQELKNQYKKMISDISSVNYESNPATSSVFTKNNEDFSQLIPNKISKVIFSPPYANSFDYFEIFKLELWMGRFIENYAQLRELRKQAIGSLWTADSAKCDMQEINQILDLMNANELWSPKIRTMILSYFSKMKNILQESYSVLLEGGKCVIVVGNSAYANVIIPTDLIISNIARDLGYKKIKILIARYSTTSSQQKKNLAPLKEFLRESVIVLEK